MTLLKSICEQSPPFVGSPQHWPSPISLLTWPLDSNSGRLKVLDAEHHRKILGTVCESYHSRVWNILVVKLRYDNWFEAPVRFRRVGETWRNNMSKLGRSAELCPKNTNTRTYGVKRDTKMKENVLFYCGNRGTITHKKATCQKCMAGQVSKIRGKAARACISSFRIGFLIGFHPVWNKF